MSYLLADLSVGQTTRIQRTFTKDDVQKCNRLTRDFNSVYDPDETVWKTYFSGPIVPGLLTEGLINEVISTKLPGTACVLLQKEMIFCHPIYINDTITAENQIIDINYDRRWVTQKVSCFNQSGKEVVKGQLVLLVLPNNDQ